MPKHRAAGMIVALACAGGIATSASAQVAGSWIGAATGEWTHPTNWTSSPLFPSANGTAIFNAGAASVALGTTIQLQHLKLDTPAQITLTQNSLTFGAGAPRIDVLRSKVNPQGVYYYTGHDFLNSINVGANPMQINGPGALTMRGNSGFTASLQLSNGVELGVTTSAALGSSFGSILLDNGTLRTISASGVATISTIDIPRTIQILPGGGTLAGITAPLRISQQIVVGGPLTFAGPAGVRLDSDINWAGDARIVGGGTIGLTLGNVGAMRFYNNLTVGGTIDVNYNSGAEDRLGAGTATLRGGTLSLNGLQTSESIGTIVLAGGQNTLRLGGTSGTFHLNATQINRTDRGTLRLIADGLGGTSGFGRSTRINLSNATNLPVIGGGGGTGSINASIIPFAHAQSVFANGYTFVTYGPNGLRALDMSEYHNDFPVDLISDANVRTSGVTNVNDPRTINSLLHGGLPQAISGSATLTITSGAMMGAGAGSFAGFISCPVDFGSAEGFVTNMNVLGPMHGTNGVTINGTSSLNTSASTYTGPTTINSGTLFLNLNADLIPGVPGPFGMDTSPIELMGRGSGAVLTINGNRAFNRNLLVRSDPDLLRNSVPLLQSTGTINGAIHLEGPLRVETTGFETILNGVISGPGRLIIGNGTSTRLAAANTFTGGVDLGSGAVSIADSAALGTGTLYVGRPGSGSFFQGSLFNGVPPGIPGQFNEIHNPIVLTNQLRIGGSGTLILAGPIDLNGESVGISQTSGVSITVTGPISNGELRWSATGTVSGQNSMQSTVIAANMLIATSSAALGVSPRYTQVGGVNSFSDATLDLRGGVAIPANPMLLLGRGHLRSSAGDNIWNGSVSALAENSITVVSDSLMVVGGIDGGTQTAGGSVTKLGNGILMTSRIRFDRALNLASGSIGISSNGTDAATSSVASLSIAGAPDAWLATFDLSDNALVIHDSTAIATIQNQLLSGYANGSWTGTGIQSSSAAIGAQHRTGIGLALGSDLFTTFPATFAGVNVDADSALLRYTLYGDANLDRTVNITDFALLAANFNVPSRWSRGDFNYDGNTNIADFALLAANFNQSLPAELPRNTIPEPVATSMFAWALLLRRRFVGTN